MLSHNYLEKNDFLTKERHQDFSIPEDLTLEGQIKYVRHNKPKVNREKTIQLKREQENEKTKKSQNNKEEFPF